MNFLDQGSLESPHSLSKSPSISSKEDSILGAEMLFNDDYLKKKNNDNDKESIVSLPLSKRSLMSHKSKSRNRDEDNYSLRSGSHKSSSLGSQNKKSSRDDDAYSSSSSSSSSSIISRSLSERSRGAKSSKSSSIIIPKKKKMSHEEIVTKKQALLYEIDRLEMLGIKYFRRLTLASSLEEIENAYERVQLDYELVGAIKSLRKVFMVGVNIVEACAKSETVQKYSPFKPRLSGWSKAVQLEIDTYDDVFKKLYIRYRSNVFTNPVLEFTYMVTFSALSFHFTSMAANSVPGLNDILQKDPTLFPKFMSFVRGGNASSDTSSPQQTTYPNTSANNTSGMGGGGDTGGGMPFISNLLNFGQNLLSTFTNPQPTTQQSQQSQQIPSHNTPTPIPQSVPPHNITPRGMPMPMAQETPATKPQMKGPSNIDDIMKYVEDNKTDNMSHTSELSEIPDDISINDVVSKEQRKPKKIIRKKN